VSDRDLLAQAADGVRDREARRGTQVGSWEEWEATAECGVPGCARSSRSVHTTAAAAISDARAHVLATGHPIDIRQVRHTVVHAVHASDGFEAAVPEFERGSWNPRMAGPQTIGDGA
jgi:hypothetical protein